MLAPDDPLYPYTAAVALHSMGRSNEAIRRLQQLAKRWPGNRDILFGLATMQRDAGQRPAALATARSLVASHPNDRGGARAGRGAQSSCIAPIIALTRAWKSYG